MAGGFLKEIVPAVLFKAILSDSGILHVICSANP
jgi:hypothetical protein